MVCPHQLVVKPRAMPGLPDTKPAHPYSALQQTEALINEHVDS